MSAKKVSAKKSVKKAPAKKSAKKVVRKAAPKKSNIERLTAAGVIPSDKVARHNHKAINKLSPVEVNTLIKLRTKLGALDAADDDLSPNFPV